MNNKWTGITGFCFVLVLVLQVFAPASINAQTLEMRYIGSQGFLISGADKKVLLDGAMPSGRSQWGYQFPAAETKENIIQAAAPFNDIDLITVSHAHDDHYSPATVLGSMKNNPKAWLVCTKLVYDKIKASQSDIAKYENRIWIPELEYYETREKTLNGIPMVVAKVPHGNMDLLVFYFEIDGITFLHSNDWIKLSKDQIDKIGFASRRTTDVAVIGANFLTNPSLKSLLLNTIKPGIAVVCHIDSATDAKLNSVQKNITALADVLPMYLPRKSLDSITVSKADGKIEYSEMP